MSEGRFHRETTEPTQSMETSRCHLRAGGPGASLGFIVAVVLLLVPVVVVCQERTPSREAPDAGRPRIGLVLGGGGARGGAHIGVLEVLEELRVPIDYIAGTSIGAIVGGLYASGMSPAEISEVIADIDFQDLFRDRPPRQELTFRRKQDDAKFPARLEVGFRAGRVRLPPGLISAQKLGVSLRSLTLPVAHIARFEELPVPFSAVATDLGTGELAVLSSGDLAIAMRASVSVPGVFAPVERDGRLLVDGGLVSNIPVDVVREMGADVVIAVDVGTPLYPAESLESAVEISAQVLRIATTQPMDLAPDLGDPPILIVPELEGVTSAASFLSVIDAVPRGREAAGAATQELSRLSVSERDYEAFLSRQRARPWSPPSVDFIRVEGDTRLAPEVIRSRLGLRPGSALGRAELERGLARVYGLGAFSEVDYRLVQEAGRNGLVIEVTDKPWGPNYLRFALALEDNLGGNSSYTFLSSYTLTNLNSPGGELRAQIQAGRTRELFAELYQPVGRGGWFFVAPRARYFRRLRDTGEDALRAEYRITDYSVGLDGGVQLGNWGELRVGLVQGRVEADPRIGPSDLATEDDRLGAFVARLGVDMLDDRSFPTRGGTVDFELTRATAGLGSDRPYDRLRIGTTGVVSRGGHALIAHLEAGTSFGSVLPVYNEFGIGGFFRLSGLRPQQLAANYLGFGRATYRMRVASLPTSLTGGALYLGVSAESGNAWDEASEISARNLRYGGTLFAGLDTILGPLYLGYGRADRGRDAWYLFLGQAF